MTSRLTSLLAAIWLAFAMMIGGVVVGGMVLSYFI
jgi:hypothetical protein